MHAHSPVSFVILSTVTVIEPSFMLYFMALDSKLSNMRCILFRSKHVSIGRESIFVYMDISLLCDNICMDVHISSTNVARSPYESDSPSFYWSSLRKSSNCSISFCSVCAFRYTISSVSLILPGERNFRMDSIGVMMSDRGVRRS